MLTESCEKHKQVEYLKCNNHIILLQNRATQLIRYKNVNIDFDFSYSRLSPSYTSPFEQNFTSALYFLK